MAQRFLYGLEEDVVMPRPRIGMALLSTTGSLLSCDEDFAAIVGTPTQQLLGRLVSEILPDLPPSDKGECVFKNKSLSFKRLRSESADLPSTLCIIEYGATPDAGVGIQQSLLSFKQLVEATPVGIVVLDESKRVVLWNKAAEGIFGWHADEIVGEIYPLVPPEERVEFAKLFDRVFQGHGFRDIESRRKRKDGSDVALSMSTTPVRDSSGRVIAALALLQDISQQRLLEEKLSERARLEAVGQLAGGVAHDFNNMLTVMSAHCGLVMKRGGVSGADLDSLIAIERCVQQASDLTKQLLTFGRKQIARPTNLDISAATRETVGMLSQILEPKIAVEMNLPSDLPPCRIDSTLFSQLLVNLITNARDAISDTGTISATTKLGELDGQPALVLTLSDTGVGIPAEHVSRVFEPFFTSKSIGKGTGLGLSTAFGIAEQAGGRLEVTSQEHHGTTFTLSLPVAESVSTSDEQRPATAPIDGGVAVLLVDDDDLVRETLAELMRLEGHVVLAVDSGIAALEAMEAETFDVVLTDVYMPGMGGAEMVRQAESIHGKLPVLFMSGNLADPDLRDRIDRGLASIIQKPIYPEELERALVEVMSGRVYR